MLPYYGNQVRLLLWRHAACNNRLTLWNQILKKITWPQNLHPPSFSYLFLYLWLLRPSYIAQVVLRCYNMGAVTDTHCCLLSVPSHHPNFNICTFQILNCVCNTILQPLQQRRRSYQSEITLNQCYGFWLFPGVTLRLLPRLLPLSVFFLRNNSLADNQSPQAILCICFKKRLCLGFKLTLVGCQPREQYRVGTFC